MIRRLNPWIAITAIALVAIAVWPFLVTRQARASHAYVAPVLADYVHRDQTVAFYEQRVHADPADQVSATLLAAQYMQRYREDMDVDDITRSLHQGFRALALQPQNNASADGVIASAYTALHRFRNALHYETLAHHEQPWDSNAPAQMASLEMELGDYPAAARDLRIAAAAKLTPTVMSVQARYDELTGHLDLARRLIDEASRRSDSVIDNSAQGRAWYHFRAGELAFSAGDVERAQAEERTALAQFPNFELAYRALARFCWASRDWRCALDAGRNGAAVAPIPESLGYEADAQAALGDAAGAARTRALIFAVERIGNAYHLNDRLLSVYYAEHRIRTDDALKIARREVGLRGDEIYAQDTLAWAAAMDGRWQLADRAMRRAIRYGTQDPRIQYHAGMIALHFGREGQARRYLSTALDLNPHFDPFYADAARKTLQRLGGNS